MERCALARSDLDKISVQWNFFWCTECEVWVLVCVSIGRHSGIEGVFFQVLNLSTLFSWKMFWKLFLWILSSLRNGHTLQYQVVEEERVMR